MQLRGSSLILLYKHTFYFFVKKLRSKYQITPLLSLRGCVGVKPSIGVPVAPPVAGGARLGEGVSSLWGAAQSDTCLCVKMSPLCSS